MKNLFNLLEWENIFSFIQTNMLKILVVILCFTISKKLKKYVDTTIKFLFQKSKMEPTVSSFLRSIFSVFYYIIVIYLLVGYLGINLSAITTFLGAAGVIFGLAFKETLGNFFSGIMILTFKPFKVGDMIEYSNYIGKIQKIELFYTKMLNPQNELVIIPNSIITNTEIRNMVKNSDRRLELTVGVSYKSDIKKVKEILKRIIKEETGNPKTEKKRETLIERLQNRALENNTNEKINILSLMFSKKKRLEVQKKEEELDKRKEEDEKEIEKLEKIKSSNTNEKMILSNYEPIIGVGELGPSSIIFNIYVFTKTENYLVLRLKLNEKIKLEFDKEGIEIPYPQLDLHLKKDLKKEINKKQD